ncbi:hypothetical protein CAF53_12435 [Sphingobium sp. LB126]|uniref:hypothetical protein n=1 Tax=Sphingobium sp. LB126 TaxID=1983755 RepID=UPI000C2075E5|nr:hypothetical protein [Sphingobium sp. LB126]PJG48950.1 hypothetical protein CAF53_12435 [Sphingobium sp. LB126]
MTRIALPRFRARRLALIAMALSLGSAFPAFAQYAILPEGMAIPLQTREDISSKSARTGDEVELAVAKPVTIGGVVVLPAGTSAVGEVTRARDNGLLGRSGKLDIRVDRLKVGQLDIPVRGQRNAKGKSGTLGSVGAGIVFLPLAILVRGKDVKLPAGTVFDVYVDQEVHIPTTTPAIMPEAAPPAQSPASPIRSVDPNEALTQ